MSEVDNGSSSTDVAVSSPSTNGMDFIDTSVNEVAESLSSKDTEKETASELAPTEAESTSSGETNAVSATSSDSVEGGVATAAIEDKAPITWKPEIAAKWAEIPVEVKQEIQRREADMFRGIEQYKGMAEVGTNFDKVFAPYKEVMQKYNVDMYATTANLMKIHERLSFGSQEERMDIIARVAADYGVDLQVLQDHVNSEDPAARKLRLENAALKEQLAKGSEAQSQEQINQHMAKVKAFADDPKNIYFAEVANDVALIIRSGVEDDLQKAYDLAVLRNPITRAKEETRIRTEAAEAERQAQAKRQQELSTATAANLQTSETGHSSTASPDATMDDTMKETLKNIHKRTGT